jgi:hypothetical protein
VHTTFIQGACKVNALEHYTSTTTGPATVLSEYVKLGEALPTRLCLRGSIIGKIETNQRVQRVAVCRCVLG